jgi:hypothetical protein
VQGQGATQGQGQNHGVVNQGVGNHQNIQQQRVVRQEDRGDSRPMLQLWHSWPSGSSLPDN